MAFRRNLSSGFSEKSLRDQEPILTKYFDLLIEKLRVNCEQPLDMAKWYNFITFDIIGDLTYGKPFGCLEDSKMHVSAWQQSFPQASTDTVTALGGDGIPSSEGNGRHRHHNEVPTA